MDALGGDSLRLEAEIATRQCPAAAYNRHSVHPKMWEMMDTFRAPGCFRDKFKWLVHHNPKVELIYRLLLNLIAFDPEVRYSSKHVRVPAHYALLGLGRDPETKPWLVMLVMEDICEGHGSWEHLMLLADIFGKVLKVPEESRGILLELEILWLKWGEENGYFVPKEKP